MVKETAILACLPQYSGELINWLLNTHYGEARLGNLSLENAHVDNRHLSHGVKR